jgi:hypothetical protein
VPATKISGHPAPLRDASGNAIPFSLSLTNQLFDAGRELPGGPFDLDALIRAYPRKSYILHPLQRVIGIIVIAAEDCSPLDAFAAASILETWLSAEGILVLAKTADARAAARQRITELLQRACERHLKAHNKWRRR